MCVNETLLSAVSNKMTYSFQSPQKALEKYANTINVSDNLILGIHVEGNTG